MENNNFSLGITLYNPSSEVLNKIRSLSKRFNAVYVYDNTEASNNNKTQLDNINNVFYFGNNTNNGLSVAYNHFLNKSFENRNDFLLILDQDSFLSDESITNLFNKSVAITEKKDDIAIIAPSVDYGNGKMPSSDLFVDYVISSGTVINLKIARESKMFFDENYFIDNVDVDFCKDVRDKGYNILQVHDAKLNQQLGEGSYRRNSHSVLRHYYMFRNDYYFYHKYYHGFKRASSLFRINIRHLLHIILFENNKGKKIKSFFVGKKDYKNGRMGKINDDSKKALA